MRDLLEAVVSVGDYVCDGRGRLYRIIHTPESLMQGRVALGIRPGHEEAEMIRLTSAVRISPGINPIKLKPKILIPYYLELAKEARPKLREELLQRKFKFFNRLKRERRDLDA